MSMKWFCQGPVGPLGFFLPLIAFMSLPTALIAQVAQTATQVPGPVTPPGSTVSPNPAVAVPFQTCRVSMAVADMNRDGQLSQTEFVAFLNRLTSNQLAFASFSTLPAGLQTTYVTLLAGAPELPIVGASPATFGTATLPQKAQLEKICTNVQLALAAGATSVPVASGLPQSSSTPLVTARPLATQIPQTASASPGLVGTGIPVASGITTPAASTPPGSIASTILPFPQCRISLAIADANRDNQLDGTEYVNFVNRLTRNIYLNFPLSGLPAALQATFYALAALTAPPNMIDITGAQPQQFATASDAQKSSLEKVCVDTQAAAAAASASATPVLASSMPVTVSPAPGMSVTAPGITLVPFMQCRSRMHAVDVNANQLLSPEEFASFVKRLAPATNYPTFASLPANVQSAYAALATAGGQINIFGAIPSQPADPVQLAFLEKVCTNTQVALAASTPTAAVGTLAPGSTVVPATVPPLQGAITLVPATVPPLTAAATLSQVPMTLLPATTLVPATVTPASLMPGSLISATTGPSSSKVPGSLIPGTTGPLGSLVPATLVPATGPPGSMVPGSLIPGMTGPFGTTGPFGSLVPATLGPATGPTGSAGSLIPGMTRPVGSLAPATLVPATGAPGSLVPNSLIPGMTRPVGSLVPATLGPATVPPGSVVPGSLIPGMTGPFGSLVPATLVPATGATASMVPGSLIPGTTTPFGSLVPATLVPATGPPGSGVPGSLIPGTMGSPGSLVPGSLVAGTTGPLGSMVPGSLVPGTAGPPGSQVPASMVPATTGPLGSQMPGSFTPATTGLPGSMMPGSLAPGTRLPGSLMPSTLIPATTGPLGSLVPATLGPVITVPPSSLVPDSLLPTTTPTLFDGLVTIYSSFIISNQVGIQAEALDDLTNSDRSSLEVVYISFVKGVVGTYDWPPNAQTSAPLAGAAASGRSLRGSRRSLVSFDSAKILDIEFRECSPALASKSCQTVYAQYLISDVKSGTQEPVNLYYTNLTQSKIRSGELQETMQNKNPNPRIVIEGATPELEIKPAVLTPAPSPTDQIQGDDGRSSGTVMFVVVVGLLALIALGVYFAWNDKDKIKANWRAWKKKRKEQNNEEEQELNSQGEGIEGEEELQYDEEGNVIYPGEGYDEEENDDDYYEDEALEETGGKKKAKKAKKLLRKLNVGKIGKHIGLGEMDEGDEDIEIMQDENVLDFDDYVFDTPAELLTEQNRRGTKFGDDGGKDGIRDSTKARPALGTSFVIGAGGKGGSIASSTSSMEGSGEEFDEDDFDDEYGSDDDDDDSEEGQDDDSFGLDISDSDDEGTISSKGLDNEDRNDDDSLSSSDERGAHGAALMCDNVEGTLAAARASQGDGHVNQDDENGDGDGDDDSGSDGYSVSSDSTTSSLEELRKEVEELVAKVVPEELDNLSTMMDQFEGREAELINTLQNMEERNSTQRARAAVHKTKLKLNPNQVGGYSIASEGSAVIAAASTLGPEPQRRQPRVQQYDDYDNEYDEEDSYYSDEYSDEEGSYYSDEEETYGEEGYDEEGTYYSDEEGTYDDEYPEDGEDYDEEGSFREDGEGTYHSGEDGEGGEEEDDGTYYSGGEGESNGGGEGSYGVEEESYYSEEEYGDGEEESYVSEEEEDNQDSYVSEGEAEEGSYYSGDENEEDYNDDGASGSYSDDDNP